MNLQPAALELYQPYIYSMRDKRNNKLILCLTIFTNPGKKPVVHPKYDRYLREPDGELDILNVYYVIKIEEAVGSPTTIWHFKDEFKDDAKYHHKKSGISYFHVDIDDVTFNVEGFTWQGLQFERRSKARRCGVTRVGKKWQSE